MPRKRQTFWKTHTAPGEACVVMWGEAWRISQKSLCFQLQHFALGMAAGKEDFNPVKASSKQKTPGMATEKQARTHAKNSAHWRGTPPSHPHPTHAARSSMEGEALISFFLIILSSYRSVLSSSSFEACCCHPTCLSSCLYK